MEKMYNEVPAITIQNGSDIISHVYDYASYLGWEVVDYNIADASGDYVVIKSEGGTKNNNRMPCYLYMYTNYTTLVNWNHCVYWDPDTHSQAGILCYTTPGTNHVFVSGMSLDSDNDNVFHFRGNKDFILFNNYRVSDMINYRSIIFRVDNLFWDIIGHIQDSGAGAAGVTTITLLEGEVEQFELGAKYRMISPDGHIDTATVSSKDSLNNQMIISGNYYPTTSGSYVGTLPFPWVAFGNAQNSSNYTSLALLQNTDYHYSTTTAYTNSYYIAAGHGMVYGVNTQVDYFNHGKVSLWPYMWYENSYGVWGSSSYIQYFDHGNAWDYFAVNSQDTGVVDEAASTTLTALNKNWVVDVLAGMTLVITSGEAEEEFRYITSNTSDTITFEPEISPVISGAETFAVCDGVFRRYPQIGGKSYLGIKVI